MLASTSSSACIRSAVVASRSSSLVMINPLMCRGHTLATIAPASAESCKPRARVRGIAVEAVIEVSTTCALELARNLGREDQGRAKGVNGGAGVLSVATSAGPIRCAVMNLFGASPGRHRAFGCYRETLRRFQKNRYQKNHYRGAEPAAHSTMRAGASNFLP